MYDVIVCALGLNGVRIVEVCGWGGKFSFMR